MEHKILKRFPLGNPRRLWLQDNFILSNFSAKGKDMRKVIRNCAEAGFNMLELGWASPEQAAEAVVYCEQLGVDLLYQELKRYGGMQGNRFYKENDLEGVINDHRKWKCIKGYYIWDEPLLDDQIEEARMLMDICEREAPDKLPFTVAIPSYNTEYTWSNGLFPKYLEKYVTVIDPPQLSLDYYPVGMGEHNAQVQFDRSRMWCDLGLMKKLGEKYNMPIWFYYQGQNLHNADFFIFPMVRAMMYAGALYGAKGLQHYTACGSIITQEGDKDIFFEDQKSIHVEFKNLGETLMALKCDRVIHDDSVVYICDNVDDVADKFEDSVYLADKLQNRVSISEYSDEYGNGYMMILNRDYMEEKDVVISLKDSYRIYEVSKEDGLQYMVNNDTNEIKVKLPAGDAVLYRLQPAVDEAFTIEYRLSK